MLSYYKMVLSKRYISHKIVKIGEKAFMLRIKYNYYFLYNYYECYTFESLEGCKNKLLIERCHTKEINVVGSDMEVLE